MSKRKLEKCKTILNENYIRYFTSCNFVKKVCLKVSSK